MVGIGIGTHRRAYTESAGAYFSAANITDPTEKAAVIALITGLKSNDLWIKFKGLYLMSPTSLAAAEVNAKTPGTFNLTAVNTPTHSSTGVDFNGTTQYFETGIIPNADLTNNDVHLSYYSRDDVNANTSEIGCGNGGSNRLILFTRTVGIMQFDCYSSGGTGRVGGAVANSLGLHVGSRISTGDSRIYQDGAEVASIATVAGTIPSVELYIGARNENGAADLFSTKQCAFASAGSGLTSAEAAIFDTLVTTYQTNVIPGGRQV